VAERLTPDEVRHVASLARLELTEPEVELFTHQLTAILEYAADVARVDTTGVPPTSHPHASQLWRDDEVKPSLDRPAALAEAPATDASGSLIRVPKVL
jgi:aspartyl-tRNA(Asn)/glutamyl-tRNA(Gln) amidotransferase subunit C